MLCLKYLVKNMYYTLGKTHKYLKEQCCYEWTPLSHDWVVKYRIRTTMALFGLCFGISNGLDPEVSLFVEVWIVNSIVLVLLLLENHRSLHNPMNIKQLLVMKINAV